MSENQPAIPIDPEPGTLQTKTAGLLLRQAREATGLHIAALAVTLKIPVKKIEALEADRLEILGDAVFTRALASSICRTLKIAPQPILERLPRSALLSIQPIETLIPAPFDATSAGRSPSRVAPVTRPVLVLAGLLLLAASALFYFPLDFSETPAVTTGPLAPPLTEVVTSLGGPATPVASAETVPVAVAVAVVPPTPNPIVSEGTLVFKQLGTSWQQVTDAKGQSLLNRHLNQGEVVTVTGLLPLSVVVGRVNMTEIQVSGKPFDLRSLSQGNVARFEVKQ